MHRSLRTRLLLLLGLLIAASLASGSLMVALFEQSASAQAGEAAAVIGRACDAIGSAYRFYTAGWPGPGATAPPRTDFTAVAETALRDRPGVEGGIWQADAGSLAYAFPTYEGTGPKTDLPAAELPRIKAVNGAAIAEDRPQAARYDAGSQTLLLSACPLPGPLPGLSAWTMTRVHAFAGRGYWQLMTGLAILLISILSAAVLSIRLTLTWSRHVGRIQTALDSHDLAALPPLPVTGERELDRIVLALNEAGRRLLVSRTTAEALSRQIAAGERLAAIGRVTAGVAHEIRNPIAAMRLKAENALAGSAERKDQALAVILAQVDRLDNLVRRLLTMTEQDKPQRNRIALGPFLTQCLAAHADVARASGIMLTATGGADDACFDAEQMRRAMDNLIINALQAASAGTTIRVGARRSGDRLQLWVEDEGAGPPDAIRAHLFDPFVTGRPEGTGLGLSIVREVAEAHGGTARLATEGAPTRFEIEVPWLPS
jgi:hypothetical protein